MPEEDRYTYDLDLLINEVVSLSGYIEDFPDNLYNPTHREIVCTGLSEYATAIGGYYNKPYGEYQTSIVQNLRLIVAKLKDAIMKLQDMKGEGKLVAFLKDNYEELAKILNDLLKKYPSIGPSEYEKSYYERKKRGTYYYPGYNPKYSKKYPEKKRVQYGKTGLSIEDSSRDEIMEMFTAPPGTYQNTSIVKPELWNYTLEKLQKEYQEYKRKNTISLSLSEDEKPKTLLELIREKGKIPERKE
jgi:hypothetical protein